MTKDINTEEIYHLIDLLEIDIRETPNKRLLSDSQKNEAIKYNTDLIVKLESILDEKDDIIYRGFKKNDNNIR